MNTTNSQQPEDEPHLLPKIEDLVALTGLFTPSLIFEELRQLEQLDAQEETEQGETTV